MLKIDVFTESIFEMEGLSYQNEILENMSNELEIQSFMQWVFVEHIKHASFVIGTRHRLKAFQSFSLGPIIQTVIGTKVQVNPRLSRDTKSGIEFVRARHGSYYRGPGTLAVF